MNNKENDTKIKKIIPSKLETGFQQFLYKTLGKHIPKNMTPNQITLIGAIGGLISMFYTYSKKSTVENSRNGIIFETAMLSQQNVINDNIDSEEAVG